MRFHLLKPLLFALFCLTLSLHAHPAAAQASPTNNQDPIISQPELDDRYLFIDAGQSVAASKGAAASSDVQFGVVRSRQVAIDVGVLTGGRSAGAQAAATSAADERKIVLNLFDDVNLIAVADKLNFTKKGFNWIGKVEGDPKSSVIIAAQDGVCSGNVRYLGKYYEIRYSPAGVHTVKEVDQGQLPDEAPPILQEDAPQSGDAVPGEAAGAGAAAPLGEGDVALPDSAGQIDVMVIYTPAARTAHGGVAGIETLINLAVLETNDAYTNSNISTTLNLVHTAEAVGYVESTFEEDLTRLTSKVDGYLDDVHTLRDVHGADLVALVRGGALTYCGIGWILQVVDPWYSEDIGFSVTHEFCATGNYTFGHELGHNQGCRHDPANAGSAGAYSYSYGYQEPSWNFRTVMAYDCPVAGGCPRIQHFSNPTVNYFGQATGTATADNALTIDNTAIAVANYRESTQAGQIPAMQSPTPGSEINDPNQVFTWTTTGIVTDHQVWIGTTPATNNVFNSGILGVSTNVQASGIPQDGNNIYVRLWYQIDGVWGFIDYVYDTFLEVPEAPVINSPAQGSTINNVPVTFSWTPGVGATQYWLTVGSAAGRADLYNDSAATATLSTSRTVTWPLTGNPVWAEVWMNSSSGWISSGSVQYSTGAGGAAQINSPTPGSTLSTSSVTFTWTPGIGVYRYWFSVTTAGGVAVEGLYVPAGTTSFTAVIPLTGEAVNVEVWTQFGSATGPWASPGPVNYATATQSGITSPPPGSTLSSSPVTFSWPSVPGIGYWFVLDGTNPTASPYLVSVGNTNCGGSCPNSVQVDVNPALSGNPVYAEVWIRKLDGSWITLGVTQYQTVNNPTFQTPPEGSTITTSPVTFSWNPVPGATRYWLTVGTTSGGQNIYTADPGGTQATVTIPLGNPIYAELWVLAAGKWSSNGPVLYQT
ncbi:MAG: zinc-dependent metalloprotease, partial [Candidatus Omnitrophica bacterium]|nr:zinc-dependent metalloprotease [Candidatus Omnitrophota bacterium]